MVTSPIDARIKKLCTKVAKAKPSEMEVIFSDLQVALWEHTLFVGGQDHEGRRRKAHPRNLINFIEIEQNTDAVERLELKSLDS